MQQAVNSLARIGFARRPTSLEYLDLDFYSPRELQGCAALLWPADVYHSQTLSSCLEINTLSRPLDDVLTLLTSSVRKARTGADGIVMKESLEVIASQCTQDDRLCTSGSVCCDTAIPY